MANKKESNAKNTKNEEPASDYESDIGDYESEFEYGFDEEYGGQEERNDGESDSEYFDEDAESADEEIVLSEDETEFVTTEKKKAGSKKPAAKSPNNDSEPMKSSPKSKPSSKKSKQEESDDEIRPKSAVESELESKLESEFNKMRADSTPPTMVFDNIDTNSDAYKQKIREKKVINDTWTKGKLVQLAGAFYDQFTSGVIPHVLMPSRTKRNLEYSDSSEVWVYGDIESERSAKTVKGAHQLLKTVYVSDFVVSEHLKNNRGSTLRELYYISEGWGPAKFGAQTESDRLIEDLEIITGAQREFFHIRPEEDGATMYGPIQIREETKRGSRDIHCQQDIGEGGYQIPFNVENIEFIRHDASMVIAVETGGMYARLIENGFDEKYNAILVHLKGQPARSTRRIIRRMNMELGLPVAVFTDGDPWSYRIFSSIAYGAIKSAHLSEFMATPDAKFLGVQPSDIVEYELATDKLTEQDIAALRSELTDPRFESKYWKEQINLQLEINKKAEQQAFAGKGLDFVTETYLPDRLRDMGIL
ncbi:DNA topoisomerase 6 subunit A [Methanolapillus millepedarum]|uniref:Type 2 DNA topoisomerase 6 subunit A n=2 Tax=Methanolapillus millepedarum TaxID=3028296 RepID=A0AA96ZU06_9EURY|nr:DNA topoisomerase 6 subunit A [Methanosarcinaceae archaeon Ac7]